MMELNEYKLFLKRYVEQVWQRGNLATLSKYISTDCIYHDSALPDPLKGSEVLADYIFHVRSALHNWHYQVEDVIGEGNTIAVRWMVQGIHQGLLGQLPPTGNPVHFSGMTLYRFEGSTITEAWNYWNRIGLVQLRTVFCACGTRLVALNNVGLAHVYRQHVDAAHQADQYGVTEEQIGSVIASCAHDFQLWPHEPDAVKALGAA